MIKPDSPAARFSDVVPPHVFRPVREDEQVQPIRDLMSRLVQENVVAKELKFYRLDTLLLRETRLISYLGQTAVDRYVEAIDGIGHKLGWDEPVNAQVYSMRAYYRPGGSGNRIVMELEYLERLKKEREQALEITRRMAGVEPPRLTRRLSVAVGMLLPTINIAPLQKRLDEVRPPEITLLPTHIRR